MPFLTKATSFYACLSLRPSFCTFRYLRILQERSHTSKPLVGPHRPLSLDDLELDPIDQGDSVRTSPIFVNKPPRFDRNDYLIPSLTNKTESVYDSQLSRAQSRDSLSYIPRDKANDKHPSSAPLNTNNISEEKARELCNILIEHLPPQMTKRELKALLNELDIKINSIVKIQNGRAFVALNGEYSLQRMLALDANLTLMQKKVTVTLIGPLRSSWRFTMDVPGNVTPEDIKQALEPLNVDVLHNKKLLTGESARDRRVVQDDTEYDAKRSHRISNRNTMKPSYGIRKYSSGVPFRTADDSSTKKGKRARRPIEDMDADFDPFSKDTPYSSLNHPSSKERPTQYSKGPTSAPSIDTNLDMSNLPSGWESINNSVISSDLEPTSTPTQEERQILRRALVEALEHGKNTRRESDVTTAPDLGYGQRSTEPENAIVSADDSRDDSTFAQLTTEAEQRSRLEQLRDNNLIYQLRVDGFGSQWRYKDLMLLIQEYEIDCSIPTGPQNGLVLMSVIGKHRFERLFRMAGLEMLLKLTLISCSTTVADMLVSLEMAQLKRDHLLENLGINIGKIWPPTGSDGEIPSLSPAKSKKPLQMIVPQYQPDMNREHYATHPDILLNIPPAIPYHPSFPFPDDDPHFGRFKESNKRSKPYESKDPSKPKPGHSSVYTKNNDSELDGPSKGDR